MSITYTTAAKVQAVLGRTTAFNTSSTTPTSTQVEVWIAEAEDYIDDQTHHSWKGDSTNKGRSSGLETHNFDFRNFARGAHRHNDYLTGYEVPLLHRSVLDTTGTAFATSDGVATFNSTAGDSFKIFNGASWVNWLTSKTEGKTGDYWVDGPSGTLFIRRFFYFEEIRMIRICYRYGEITVPSDICEAATLYTAIKVLESENAVANVPSGPGMDVVPIERRCERWERKIQRIIDRHTEMQGMFF
jgi:hypothetical protein